MHSSSLSVHISRDKVKTADSTVRVSIYTAILDTASPGELGVEAYWSSWMLSPV